LAAVDRDDSQDPEESHASDGAASDVHVEDWNDEIETTPVTHEELKTIMGATPSHWTQIQPAVSDRLPISSNGRATPSPEDLNTLLEIYNSYPFNTSQDPNELRAKITWKSRRGGDMAMIAGTTSLPYIATRER
jgi:hypothetical protein